MAAFSEVEITNYKDNKIRQETWEICIGTEQAFCYIHIHTNIHSYIHIWRHYYTPAGRLGTGDGQWEWQWEWQWAWQWQRAVTMGTAGNYYGFATLWDDGFFWGDEGVEGFFAFHVFKFHYAAIPPFFFFPFSSLRSVNQSVHFAPTTDHSRYQQTDRPAACSQQRQT